MTSFTLVRRQKRLVNILKYHIFKLNYMNIIENIKAYFRAKEKGDETLHAPEGVCPNCWGKQEWDNEFYKINKSKDTIPDGDRYNNFIQDVVVKLDKITINKDTYTCETCQLKYKDS